MDEGAGRVERTRSLRLLLFSPRHPSVSSVGVANVVSALARSWSRSGHEVRVAFPENALDARAPSVWEGVRAVPLAAQGRPHRPKSLERALAEGLAEEARDRTDVVIANNEYGAFLPSRRTGGSVLSVVVLHGLVVRFMELERATRRGLRPRAGYYPDLRAVRSLERSSIERADRVVAISRRVLRDAQATYALDPARSSVIYNGQPAVPPPRPEERERARAHFSAAPRTRLLALVGGDPYRKGLDVARAAVAKLRAQGEDVRLLHVGGDTAPEEDGVVGLGRVSDPMLREVMVASDLLLLPSRYEGFPMIAQEAAALGLPIVASEASGLDLGRPGQSHVEVRSGGSGDWAEAVRALLKDDAARERIAEGGRRELSGRTLEEMAEDYRRLIKSERFSGAWTPTRRPAPRSPQ